MIFSAPYFVLLSGVIILLVLLISVVFAKSGTKLYWLANLILNREAMIVLLIIFILVSRVTLALIIFSITTSPMGQGKKLKRDNFILRIILVYFLGSQILRATLLVILLR